METPANRQRVELPPNPEEKLSKRYLAFREKLRSEAPLEPLPECAPHPAHEKEPLKPWPNNTNPYTGEIGGQAGPEPTRYGDWERKGRVTDFWAKSYLHLDTFLFGQLWFINRVNNRSTHNLLRCRWARKTVRYSSHGIQIKMSKIQIPSSAASAKALHKFLCVISLWFLSRGFVDGPAIKSKLIALSFASRKKGVLRIESCDRIFYSHYLCFRGRESCLSWNYLECCFWGFGWNVSIHLKLRRQFTWFLIEKLLCVFAVCF